jgi:hypothetical protein
MRVRLIEIKPSKQFFKGVRMGAQSNYALRLPSSLKAEAEVVAREDGTTLNQFIVSAVAEKLAALKTADFFAERAKRGDLDQALQLLSRSEGEAPSKNDLIAKSKP